MSSPTLIIAGAVGAAFAALSVFTWVSIKARDHEIAGLNATLGECRADFALARSVNEGLAEKIAAVTVDRDHQRKLAEERLEALVAASAKISKARSDILKELTHAPASDDAPPAPTLQRALSGLRGVIESLPR